VKFGKPQGRRWRRIPGALVQIESGPDGAVWGVNMEGLVFTRRGVSQRNPIGSSWKAVGRKHLTTVSVGLGYVFGIDNIGKPYIGDVAKFLGRNGLPKKPSMFTVVLYFSSGADNLLECCATVVRICYIATLKRSFSSCNRLLSD
jgi:hypothetical protein